MDVLSLATAKSERQAREGLRLPVLTLHIGEAFNSKSESDVVASNETNHVSIRYRYEGDVITAGIALDELEDPYDPKPGEGPNTLGVAGPPVEGFLRFQRDV